MSFFGIVRDMQEVRVIDALSALEEQPFGLVKNGPSPAWGAAEAKVEQEVELAGLRARCAAQESRIKLLEDRLAGAVGDDDKIESLSAEVERLRVALAESEARFVAQQKFLPAASAADRHELQIVAKKLDEARFEVAQVSQAFELATRENVQLKETVDNLEYQRDERDDMLRREEVRRQTSEARQKKIALQAALMRSQFIRDKGAELSAKSANKTDEYAKARTRVMAALGDAGAQVDLGGDYLDGACALCRANPACERARLLNWPHGTLVPRDVQSYLQVLVDSATDKGEDPFLALEAWASGALDE